MSVGSPRMVKDVAAGKVIAEAQGVGVIDQMGSSDATDEADGDILQEMQILIKKWELKL